MQAMSNGDQVHKSKDCFKSNIIPMFISSEGLINKNGRLPA